MTSAKLFWSAIAPLCLYAFLSSKGTNSIHLALDHKMSGDQTFTLEAEDQSCTQRTVKNLPIVESITKGTSYGFEYYVETRENVSKHTLYREFWPEGIRVWIEPDKKHASKLKFLATYETDRGDRVQKLAVLSDGGREIEYVQWDTRDTQNKIKKPEIAGYQDLFFTQYLSEKSFISVLTFSLKPDRMYTRTILKYGQLFQTTHDAEGFILYTQVLELPLKLHKQFARVVDGERIDLKAERKHQRDFGTLYRPFDAKHGDKRRKGVEAHARNLQDQAQKEYSRKLLSELDSKSERSKTTIRPAHTVDNSVFESHSTHPMETSVHSRHHRAARSGISQRSRTYSSSDRTSDSSSDMSAYSNTSHDYFKKPESVSLSDVDYAIDAASSRGSERSKYRQHTSHRPLGTMPKYVEAGFYDL